MEKKHFLMFIVKQVENYLRKTGSKGGEEDVNWAILHVLNEGPNLTMANIVGESCFKQIKRLLHRKTRRKDLNRSRRFEFSTPPLTKIRN